MFTQKSPKHRLFRNDKGLALPTVLVISTALALAGNAFLATNNYEAGSVNDLVVQEQKFNVLESAMERAKLRLTGQSQWTSSTWTQTVDMTVNGNPYQASASFGGYTGNPVAVEAISNDANSGKQYKISLSVVPEFGGGAPYKAALCGCKEKTANPSGIPAVSFSGTSLIDSYFSSGGKYSYATSAKGSEGDVGSMGSASLGGNAQVKGEIIAISDVTSNGNAKIYENVTTGGTINTQSNAAYEKKATASGNVAMNSNAYIKGDLWSGGNLSGISNNKIYGSAKLTGNATAWSGWVGNGLTTGAEPPPTIDPAVNAPCNCSYFNVANEAAAAAASNNNASCSKIVNNKLDIAANTTTTLTAGTYYLTQLSINGNAEVTVNSSGGPIKIVLDGAGPFEFAGNGKFNNDSSKTSQLTLVSNSTADIKFTGNSYTIAGTIFAPKAKIYRSGNATFFGSFLGYIVEMSGNADVHFDTYLESLFGGKKNPDGDYSVKVGVVPQSWTYTVINAECNG